MPKRIWCRKCQRWVDCVEDLSLSTRQALDKTRTDHRRWCGLEAKVIAEHPDLQELEAFVDSMFGET